MAAKQSALAIALKLDNSRTYSRGNVPPPPPPPPLPPLAQPTIHAPQHQQIHRALQQRQQPQQQQTYPSRMNNQSSDKVLGLADRLDMLFGGSSQLQHSIEAPLPRQVSRIAEVVPAAPSKHLVPAPKKKKTVVQKVKIQGETREQRKTRLPQCQTFFYFNTVAELSDDEVELEVIVDDSDDESLDNFEFGSRRNADVDRSTATSDNLASPESPSLGIVLPLTSRSPKFSSMTGVGQHGLTSSSTVMTSSSSSSNPGTPPAHTSGKQSPPPPPPLPPFGRQHGNVTISEATKARNNAMAARAQSSMNPSSAPPYQVAQAPRATSNLSPAEVVADSPTNQTVVWQTDTKARRGFVARFSRRNKTPFLPPGADRQHSNLSSSELDYMASMNSVQRDALNAHRQRTGASPQDVPGTKPKFKLAKILLRGLRRK
jgi:hypothetical protein